MRAQARTTNSWVLFDHTLSTHPHLAQLGHIHELMLRATREIMYIYKYTDDISISVSMLLLHAHYTS